MPHHYERLQELEERVKQLRANLARREGNQNCAFPILDAIRKELVEAERQVALHKEGAHR